MNQPRTIGLILGAALLLTGACAFAQTPSRTPQKLPVEAQVTIGERTFQLEVARTPRQKSMGLMYRTDLPADRGMLFVFDPPGAAGFWMMNTLIPLDIVFTSRGRVVYIAAAVPCKATPCPIYGPDNFDPSIDLVLEFNGGTADKLGLKAGDRLDIQFLKPSRPGA